MYWGKTILVPMQNIVFEGKETNRGHCDSHIRDEIKLS